MKEAFINKKFSPKSKTIITLANQILGEYAAQGYDLSLRQLFYQFVSRDWLPNTQQTYSNLGSIISDARLAGLIDWDMIRDRGRVVMSNPHWEQPSGILRASADQFRLDLWKNQPTYCEVMVEKQALEGVLIPVCRELDVAFTANKGYSSSSALYEAAKRMDTALRDGQKEVHVIYLGDHDPSGIDMSRDITDRLELFLRINNPGEEPDYDSPEYDEWEARMFDHEQLWESFFVHRVALNYGQVQQYNPPENPAKMTDSRVAGYIAKFGNSSWELDALNPAVLADLVRNQVYQIRDAVLWEQAVAQQIEYRKALSSYADEWDASHT